MPPRQQGQLAVEDSGTPTGGPQQAPSGPTTFAPVVKAPSVTDVSGSVAKTQAEADLEAQIFGGAPASPHPVPVAVASPAPTPPAQPPVQQTYAPPPPAPAPVQPAPVVEQTPEVDWAGPDGPVVDDDFDFLATQTPKPEVLTQQLPQAPIVPPDPHAGQPVQVHFKGPMQKAQILTPPAPQNKFKYDDELTIAEKEIAEIEAAREALQFHLGILLLSEPTKVDKNSKAHEAIFLVRWHPQKILELPPHDILVLGAALSAHQVMVGSLEAEWKARYQLLKTELDRIVFLKRDSYETKTKAEAEELVIKNEPRVRDLRRQYLMAQYMSTALEGRGEAFAQMENALKRPADFRANEYRKETGGQWQHRQ
jgi:hypothetical protein